MPYYVKFIFDVRLKSKYISSNIQILCLETVRREKNINDNNINNQIN